MTEGHPPPLPMDTAAGGTHPIGMHSCDSCFFSFRFPEIFAYAEGVEVMQENLNELIEGGVQKITTLVRNTEMAQTMDIESGTMYLHLLLTSFIVKSEWFNIWIFLRTHLLSFESID